MNYAQLGIDSISPDRIGAVVPSRVKSGWILLPDFVLPNGSSVQLFVLARHTMPTNVVYLTPAALESLRLDGYAIKAGAPLRYIPTSGPVPPDVPSAGAVGFVGITASPLNNDNQLPYPAEPVSYTETLTASQLLEMQRQNQ